MAAVSTPRTTLIIAEAVGRRVCFRRYAARAGVVVRGSSVLVRALVSRPRAIRCIAALVTTDAKRMSVAKRELVSVVVRLLCRYVVQASASIHRAITAIAALVRMPVRPVRSARWDNANAQQDKRFVAIFVSIHKAI
jgi:hypothetical protein